MAELNRAVAALRIVGDGLQPDELTELLGAQPSKTFARGQLIEGRRTSPRTAKFGLWTLEAAETSPGDLDAQVAELMTRVTADLSVWHGLAARFGVELFCGWFMKRGNEGVFIRPETLQALADRRIALDLDIYSGDDE